MDLQAQIKELRDLEYLLVSKNVVVRKRDELSKNYEKGLEDASNTNLPVAPVQPKEPKMPTRPKHIEVDGMVNPALFLFGMGFLALSAKKKQKKEAEEKNQLMDAEYAAKSAQYEKDKAKWKKDMAVYTDAYAKWQLDVKKKTEENIEKYKKDNANVLEEVKQLDAEIAELDKRIVASTVLSHKDKNLDVVWFLIDKLDSGRADSVMMALNMYDDKVRKDQEFRAKLEFDSFNQRMEADRRRQWEAEQSMKQWSHNRQMEEYARETRNYERDQAKALEEIRKAAERNS